MDWRYEPPIKILLIDDHDVVRETLSVLLEHMMPCDIVHASSADEGVRLTLSERPDLILLDCRMPGHDGLWALERIRESHIRTPILMVSSFDAAGYVDGAAHLGANGYMLKGATRQEFEYAISVVLNGGVYVSPNVVTRNPNTPWLLRDVTNLSKRQWSIVEVLSQGGSDLAVARAIDTDPETASKEIEGVVRALGARDISEAMAQSRRAVEMARSRRDTTIAS